MSDIIHNFALLIFLMCLFTVMLGLAINFPFHMFALLFLASCLYLSVYYLIKLYGR